jgi:hydrogenase expression/formation protein HypE
MPTPAFEGWTCPLPLQHYPTIVMGHGSGGKMMNDLIRHLFAEEFHSPLLGQLADAADIQVGSQRLAITTDSFVVSPLFFPGGDIGELAVNGTIDLAAAGEASRPLLDSSWKGCRWRHWARDCSMAQACERAGCRSPPGTGRQQRSRRRHIQHLGHR